MAQITDRLSAALADRYRIERRLGEGGMATVYLARDLKHDRQVAVKVMRPEIAAVLGPERFLREIKITAQLNHPHILPLLDSGDADGLLYYVMPYMTGESLRDRLNRETQLPIEDAVRITREVADALEAAHAKNVIHRDIKPENILLERNHAVVADFGIARAISDAGGEQLTETGIAVGTPAYMSPEQAAADKDSDGRTDVYALGCVLYEMLAGQPPFTGPTAQSIVHQHLAIEPRLVTEIRQAVPERLAVALQGALAKNPADRYADAAAFGAALVPRVSATVAPVTGLRRRMPRLALLGIAGAIVLGGLLVMLQRTGGSSDIAEPVFERTAIAVLPLQNLSTDESQAYFAGGLHDELLTQLSKVAALKVISRTSVAGYTGPDLPPLRQIADELGVGSVVEGSVQVLGGRLRVNIQLIDATTDAHIWAQRYDGTLDDAFAVQSDIAQQIVAAVNAVLSSEEQLELAAASTENAEAYRLFLQGREYQTRPGLLPQDLEIAQRLYERALTLDSGFALARATLSQVHGFIYWFRFDPSMARAERQREEAEAALRLEPDLPQAHAAMGLAYYFGRRDYSKALDEFRLALDGLPNDGWLWYLLGALNRRLGNWDEVVAAFEKATQLNPRDVQMLADLGGNTFLALRRYPDAVRVLDRALSLAPDFHAVAVHKAWIYVFWQGQLDTLRSVLSHLPTNVELGPRGTWTDHRARLLYWERQADSLLNLLARTSTTAFEAQDFFVPVSMFAARAHQLRGDSAASRAAFDSARVLLDSVITEHPDDARVHAARGLALAGLGLREEALREARWLEESVVYREDKYGGPHLMLDRARILSQAGETDAALDEIERLLGGPSVFVSVHSLRLDPLWDPIRDNPRFAALLAQYRN